MAVMLLNSRMVKWSIELSAPDGVIYHDLTHAVAPSVSSIRIRHGISGGTLRKGSQRSSAYEVQSYNKQKRETSPSELDMQIASNSYLADMFEPGVGIKIYFWDDYDKKTLCFDGLMRNYPYGAAQELVNFNIRAFSKEIFMSTTGRKKTFQARPLTINAIVQEIAAINGLKCDVRTKKKNDKLPPSKYRQAGSKGESITDMEMLEWLAGKTNCAFVFTDKYGLIFDDKENLVKTGDELDIKSFGPYPLGYRSADPKIFCNVESVDWIQNVNPGGGVEPSSFGYDEKGQNYDSKKLFLYGKTWKMKPEYVELSKRDKLAFRQLTSHSIGLTTVGQGKLALTTYYEPIGDDADSINTTIPSEGDQSGIELTIKLNEGDVHLRAPRTALLHAGGGNFENSMNVDLPSWLFGYSGSPYKALLNVYETVLTYEQGILQSELKCTVRTEDKGRA